MPRVDRAAAEDNAILMKENDSAAADPLRTEMMHRIGALALGKSLCPTEIARALEGSDTARWSGLMPAIRRLAVDMAKGGQVVILRKGKTADPDDFRGVYRLARPRQD